MELQSFNLTMRKNPMTNDSMQLSELIEKAGADDFVREMLGFVAQRMMELDVEGAAVPATASAPRHAPIHATDFVTGTGIRVPARWRYASRSCARAATSALSGARRTSEKALAAVIQEAYVQGISTRSVDDLVKAMGMTGISKSQVSRLCAEIDERVHGFLDRPIEGDWLIPVD